MPKKCAICNSEIQEEFGKLLGTQIKIVENKKASFIFVCSDCQKENNKDSKWIEKAKVKAA
jgi:DNA-directed RNA polymerase subunit RPC12/RpoP